MKKLAWILIASLFSAPQAMAACASKTEQQSLHMRALQSELMVAALACGKKADYNRYVNTFSPDLQWQGKQLKSFFSRNYGTRSERELNGFVTQMANQASRLSLEKNSRDYCNNAAKLFTKINALRPWQVIDYAKTQYTAWHSIANCDAKPQVVASAATNKF